MQYTIVTFGCQMNEADSRLMAAVLDHAGWEEADAPQESDLVIINTCSVREKPEHKVYSLLGEFRELRPLRAGADAHRRRLHGPAGGEAADAAAPPM